MKIKSIFDNIDEKEIEKIYKILETSPVTISKNKVILTNETDNNTIGIILNGTANIEKYDYDGNRSILEKLDKNSLFGNIFFRPEPEISIVSTSECEVLLFEYNSFINKIKNKVIVNNFFQIYNEEILKLNTRIEILSKRTIREKLLIYFFVNNKSKKTFELPYTYTELADYLCVDRSAMMRELKKMKEMGIIKTNGKKIRLLN